MKNKPSLTSEQHKKIAAKVIMLITPIIIFMGIGNSSFCQIKEPLRLQLSLPKDIVETNFEENSTYYGQLNGTQISFTGVPFLKDGITYVPVRDIANSFGFGLEYDSSDRHIKLITADKTVVISPISSLAVGSSVIIEVDKNIQNEQRYILVNNRSYLPLRYILEALSYSVVFDSANKKIIITGEPSSAGVWEASISTEQKDLISALSSYEGASNVTVRGKIKVGYETENIAANITRSMTENEQRELIEVHSGNSQYRTERTDGDWGIGYSLKEIFQDGTERQINLMGWGSNHPYFYIGDTGLSGIIKYSNPTIVDSGIKNGNRVLKVTVKNENTKTIEIGIDPLTNKIKTFTVHNQEGEIERELSITY